MQSLNLTDNRPFCRLSVSFYSSEVACGVANTFAIVLSGVAYAALQLKFLGNVMTVATIPKENVHLRLFSLLNLSDLSVAVWERVHEVRRCEPALRQTRRA